MLEIYLNMTLGYVFEENCFECGRGIDKYCNNDDIFFGVNFFEEYFDLFLSLRSYLT